MGRCMCYVATAVDAGQRLDSVLANNACFASRSAAAKAVEAGLVQVGGVVVAKRYTVRQGDAIVYEVMEEARGELVGSDIPLDVRYEDLDVLVLSKQVGLVCHPSIDHRDDTLVNALIHHCGIDNLCNVQGEEDDRLGIVHRLDRDTSGLMLAAKSDEAGYLLMDAIRARAVDRHYLALVHGVIAPDTGMIDAPISRSANDRLRMAVRDIPQARNAVTTFTVLKRYSAGKADNGFTLIDCKLFTGRTHQIRVHMEYTKHPLVGDPVYRTGAPKSDEANLKLKRQFLHSYRLGFEHPITEEWMEFFDNPAADLMIALESLTDREVETTAAGAEVLDRLTSAPVPSVEGEVPEDE